VRVSLAEGPAREIESAALFPAGAVARAPLELVGLTSRARKTIPAAAAKPADAQPLHAVVDQWLAELSSSNTDQASSARTSS
jgi:hypothetical protein